MPGNWTRSRWWAFWESGSSGTTDFVWTTTSKSSRCCPGKSSSPEPRCRIRWNRPGNPSPSPSPNRSPAPRRRPTRRRPLRWCIASPCARRAATSGSRWRWTGNGCWMRPPATSEPDTWIAAGIAEQLGHPAGDVTSARLGPVDLTTYVALRPGGRAQSVSGPAGSSDRPQLPEPLSGHPGSTPPDPGTGAHEKAALPGRGTGLLQGAGGPRCRSARGVLEGARKTSSGPGRQQSAAGAPAGRRTAPGKRAQHGRAIPRREPAGQAPHPRGAATAEAAGRDPTRSIQPGAKDRAGHCAGQRPPGRGSGGSAPRPQRDRCVSCWKRETSGRHTDTCSAPRSACPRTA